MGFAFKVRIRRLFRYLESCNDGGAWLEKCQKLFEAGEYVFITNSS